MFAVRWRRLRSWQSREASRGLRESLAENSKRQNSRVEKNFPPKLWRPTPHHGAAYSEQSRAHAGLLMCHGYLSIMHQQPSDIPHNCHDVRSSPTIYTDVLSAERPYRRPRLCPYSSRCRCRLSLLSSLVSTVRRGPGAPVNAIMN